MSFRVRELDLLSSSQQVIGQFYWTNNGASKHVGPFSATVGPGIYQKCFDEKHTGPPYRSGGPFYLIRLTEPISTVGGGILIGRDYVGPGNSVIGAVKPGDKWRYNYSGGFAIGGRGESLGSSGVNVSSASPDSYREIDPNNLDSLGSRAYDIMRPKVERAGLFQAIAESQDLPRMLQTTGRGLATAWQDLQTASRRAKDRRPGLLKPSSVKTMRPKALADQFLNVQFGWKPFVKDVVAMCDVITNFHEYVAKAENKNGRWQKRKFSEDVVQTEDSVSQANNMDTNMGVPTLDASIMVPKSGTYRVARQKMTRVWYEAEFKRYDLEFDPSVMRGYPRLKAAAQAVKLFGADISPTHLWQIMPWSWCADWFVNVKHNIQLFDDLATGSVAARYFYLMRYSYLRWEYLNRFSSYGSGQVDLRWYRSVEIKRRVGSESHFGFSLQPGQLSGMQLMILAALGLSSGR